MSISTKYEDAIEMTKLFKTTFKSKTNMTFISKSYFFSLDEISKLQFIESQIAYTKTHRSILLRGIKETHIPSIHTTTQNKPLLLTECLRDVRDYQNNWLFSQIYPPVNNMVEVHILNKNLSLALEWEKQCIGHIARQIERKYYNKVFNMTHDELENIQPSPEPWALPSPPDIEFLVPQQKAWTQIPKTISQTNDSGSIQQKSSKPSNSINKNKSKYATDTQTAVIATTFQSDNIDVISELQDECRQHTQLIDDHTIRIQSISQQIQELQSLQSWTDRILNLKTKYKKIMQHNTDISSDLNNISNFTIPAITATLTGIKEIETINDTKLNKVGDKVKQKLQRQQREIDNLYMIIKHEFQNNPVTPSDLRQQKKNKQRSSEDKLNTKINENNSQMSEDDQHTIETTTETIRQNLCNVTN
jgi:hypothetical protein